MCVFEEQRPRCIFITEWVIFTLWLILMIILGVIYWDDVRTTLEDGDNDILKILLICLIVAMGIQVLLNILLTMGVVKKNYCACKTWYIINIVFCALYAIDIVLSIAALNIVGAVISAAGLVYRVYAVRTIRAFSRNLGNSNTGGFVYSVNDGVNPPLRWNSPPAPRDNTC